MRKKDSCRRLERTCSRRSVCLWRRHGDSVMDGSKFLWSQIKRNQEKHPYVSGWKSPRGTSQAFFSLRSWWGETKKTKFLAGFKSVSFSWFLNMQVLLALRVEENVSEVCSKKWLNRTKQASVLMFWLNEIIPAEKFGSRCSRDRIIRTCWFRNPHNSKTPKTFCISSRQKRKTCFLGKTCTLGRK